MLKYKNIATSDHIFIFKHIRFPVKFNYNSANIKIGERGLSERDIPSLGVIGGGGWRCEEILPPSSQLFTKEPIQPIVKEPIQRHRPNRLAISAE